MTADLGNTALEKEISSIISKHDLENPSEQEQAWQEVSSLLCSKRFSKLGFAENKKLFDHIYSKRKSSDGPPFAWLPSREVLENSNTYNFMKELGLSDYRELHRWSVENKDLFWEKIMQKLGIGFKKNPGKISDLSNGPERPVWLPGAEINIVDSCFKADKEKTAIYFSREQANRLKIDETDPEQSGKIGFDRLNKFETWTYGFLEEMVNSVANGLVEKGFEVGDVIGIDMPMAPESVAAYLGIIKAGCVVLSIPDSFAAPEIKKRLEIGKAKAIFTMDYYIRDGKRLEMYSKVKEAGKIPVIVIPYFEKGNCELKENDFLWKDFLSEKTGFVSVGKNPHDPTNILFSSGTTGEPKAIPWDHTTPIKAVSDSYFHQDIKPDDILVWPTNLGWMMGPWLIYASFINKASMGLFVGYYGEQFGKFVQDTGASMVGVIPSLVSMWKTKKCMEGLDWSKIKRFSSTGECSRKEDMLYLMWLAGYKPIIEYCGGTEIGGVYITGTMVQPCSPAAFSTPAMGVDFTIMDENWQKTKNGEVFIIPPSIGLSHTILNRDNFEVYYQGCPKPNGSYLRRHGDQVEELAKGYYMVHGRVDDIMVLFGAKTGSAEIERALHTHPDVAETAAIAVKPKDGGPNNLVIYTVPSKDNSILNKEKLKADFQGIIKSKISPLFRIHDIVLTGSLPRTASNKVMRRLLRDEYQKQIQGY